MKTASITEAKNNLSALIDGFKSGSPVLIVDRGRPVARMKPVITGDQGGQDGRLSRLLRDGVVRPRRAEPPRRSSPAGRRARVPEHRRSMRSSKSAGKEVRFLGIPRRLCRCWSPNRRRGVCKRFAGRDPSCWSGGATLTIIKLPFLHLIHISADRTMRVAGAGRGRATTQRRASAVDPL